MIWCLLSVGSDMNSSLRCQLSLQFRSPRGWGGARANAGRPRTKGRRNVQHGKREAHRKAWPVLVTLRARCRSLRHQFVFPTLRGAIADTTAARPGEFRVCEFSVQEDHLHLLVEARDDRALTRGVAGLCVRMAKRVNKLLFRSGPFFADRHHRIALKTPRAVRNAIVYVLANVRKHRNAQCAPLDLCSSAPYFRAFDECSGRSPIELGIVRFPRALQPPLDAPRAEARTWLLSVGWRRSRMTISIRDVPAT